MRPKELTEKTANNIGEMLALRKLHGVAMITTAEGQSPMSAIVTDDYCEAGKMMARLYIEVLGWLCHEGQDREATALIEGFLSVVKKDLNKRQLRNAAMEAFQAMNKNVQKMQGRTRP